MLNQRTLQIISIVLGGILLVSLIFLVLFGVRLSNYGKSKTQEIQTDLDAQAKQLKADFQSEKEVTTTTYTASDIFGSFQFSYPKVWSTNVSQDSSAENQLIFLADPSLIISDKQAKGPFTALRVQVFASKYDEEVKAIRNKYIVNEKSPYVETSVTLSGLSGKKYAGTQAESGKKITFVLLPLRDKTLYIGTDDSSKYSKNFDTISKSFKVSK